MHGDDFADRPVVNPLDALAVSVVNSGFAIPRASSGSSASQGGRGLHATDADRIDAVRLLTKRACRRRAASAYMDGTRGTGDQRHVDAIDHFLVTAEAGEEMILIGGDLPGQCFLNHSYLNFSRSGKCRAGLPASRRGRLAAPSSAAPLQRRPQPIVPILISCLPAACACGDAQPGR